MSDSFGYNGNPDQALKSWSVKLRAVAQIIANIQENSSSYQASNDSALVDIIARIAALETLTTAQGVTIAAHTAALAALPTLAAGTYTPTLYNTTNVAASTPYVTQYIRVGNNMIGFGKCDIDVTATGNTVLGMSLPIASAIANDREAGGVFYGDTTTQGGAIYGDAANDRLILKYSATSTANTGFFFIWGCRII